MVDMTDESSNGTVIRLPGGWLKTILGVVFAGLVGGGGGTWFSSDRVVRLETKVEALEKEAALRRERDDESAIAFKELFKKLDEHDAHGGAVPSFVVPSNVNAKSKSGGNP